MVNTLVSQFLLFSIKTFVTIQRFDFFSKNGKRAINGRIYFLVFSALFKRDTQEL
jgi:hypothetical protein